MIVLRQQCLILLYKRNYMEIHKKYSFKLILWLMESPGQLATELLLNQAAQLLNIILSN